MKKKESAIALFGFVNCFLKVSIKNEFTADKFETWLKEQLLPDID